MQEFVVNTDWGSTGAKALRLILFCRTDETDWD